MVIIPDLSEEPTQAEINRIVLAEKKDGINRTKLRTRFQVLRKEALACTEKKK